MLEKHAIPGHIWLEVDEKSTQSSLSFEAAFLHLWVTHHPCGTDREYKFVRFATMMAMGGEKGAFVDTKMVIVHSCIKKIKTHLFHYGSQNEKS